MLAIPVKYRWYFYYILHIFFNKSFWFCLLKNINQILNKTQHICVSVFFFLYYILSFIMSWTDLLTIYNGHSELKVHQKHNPWQIAFSGVSGVQIYINCVKITNSVLVFFFLIPIKKRSKCILFNMCLSNSRWSRTTFFRP